MPRTHLHLPPLPPAPVPITVDAVRRQMYWDDPTPPLWRIFSCFDATYPPERRGRRTADRVLQDLCMTGANLAAAPRSVSLSDLVLGALDGWICSGACLGHADDWISNTPGALPETWDLAVRAPTISSAIHWRYAWDDACFFAAPTIEARHQTEDAVLWSRLLPLWTGPASSPDALRAWNGAHRKLAVLEGWNSVGLGHSVCVAMDGVVYDVLRDRPTRPTADSGQLLRELRTSMPRISSVHFLGLPDPLVIARTRWVPEGRHALLPQSFRARAIVKAWIRDWVAQRPYSMVVYQ